MSYVPGDIVVSQLTIGGLEFKDRFISFDVYESIYTPGIIADINILDTEDYLPSIRGALPVVMVFSNPGGITAEYNLVINKITNISSTPSNHSKSYTVEAVSVEILKSKSLYISKKYNNTQYSQMASDVFYNFLGGRRGLEIEQTKGMHKYAIQNEKPFDAIDEIRRRSVSGISTTSTYLFYENRYGYHFVTLEKLFRDNVIVKQLFQNAAVGLDMESAPSDNIIAYVGRQQMDIASTIGAGGAGGAYGTFNMFTLDFVEKAVGGLTGGPGSLIGSFIGGGQPGLKNIMATSNEKETGLGGDSEIAESAPGQQSYAAAVGSTSMSISTFGDCVFTAGVSVHANISKKDESTSNKGAETGLNETFLIASMRHQVRGPGARPRFVTILECVKDRLETD